MKLIVGFATSACGPFTKHRKSIQNLGKYVMQLYLQERVI